MSARFSCTRLGGFFCVEKSRVLGWPGGLRVETWPLRANGTYVRSLALTQRLLAVNRLSAGALLVLAQVVTAPAIGDCEMLDGLKLIAPPGRVTQPITPAARIVAVLARHSQVGRMARATISAAQQVFQCSSIWPRSVVWSVRQHDVLSAVAATPLLLPEQKPFEIPCSARVHRCLHLVGAFMVRRRRLLISAAAGQHA